MRLSLASARSLVLLPPLIVDVVMRPLSRFHLPPAAAVVVVVY